MVPKLNRKQKSTYNFLKQKIHSYGHPPSIEEICLETKSSSIAEVKENLSVLKDLGYIETNEAKDYIKILEEDFYSLKVNIKNIKDENGNIYKNIPIFTLKTLQKTVPAIIKFLKSNKYFLVNNIDNSMDKVGIPKNSTILIDPNIRPEKYGEILLVYAENKVLLRAVFADEEDNFVLKSPDDSIEDIITKNIIYIGKLVHVFRKPVRNLKNTKKEEDRK